MNIHKKLLTEVLNNVNHILTKESIRITKSEFFY